MTLLWLDDIRNPFESPWSEMIQDNSNVFWVKSYKEFTNYIKEFGIPDIIDFDHDLGLDYNGDIELNGCECAKFVLNYCIDNNINAPQFLVHSSNLVGKENILSLKKTFDKIYGE